MNFSKKVRTLNPDYNQYNTDLNNRQNSSDCSKVVDFFAVNCKTREQLLEEKGQLLMEYADINIKLPSQKEEYKGVKLGIFWSSIKQGRCKELYDNVLSKKPIIKKAMDDFLLKN